MSRGDVCMRVEPLEPRVLLAFDPSALEQAMLEDINRFRTDPQGELDVLFTSLNPLFSSDPDVQGALDFFPVDSAALQSQWATLEPVPPVAWNELLNDAADGHNRLMIENDEQAHQFTDEPDIGDRIRDTGYPARRVAENVYAFGQSTFHAHAGFIIDWGDTPTGIQDPPGHRINMMNGLLQEVGISIDHDDDPKTSVGPMIVTQDFAARPNYLPQILGVVYNDTNRSGGYDAGEGLARVNIEIIGAGGDTYRTTSMSAGGYQLEVPKGSYTVIASGGRLAEPLAAANVVMTGENVKLDFDPTVSLRPPLAVDDVQNTREDAAVTVNVLANDSDRDGSLDRSTVTVTTQPRNGTVSVNTTTGAIRYQPNANYFGSDTFGYRVKDNDGVISNEGTVRVSVGGVNDAPRAVNDSTVTNEETPKSINVLANDTDVDGTIDPGTLRIVSPPRNGNAEVDAVTGVVTYTPRVDFFGDDSFRYTVRDDGGAASNVATVSISVRDVNDAPIAANDLAVTRQDSSIAIDVTANDSDVDGTVSRNTVAITRFPGNGQLRVNSATGVVTYSPREGYVGADSFRYVVLDNDLAISSEALVSIIVTESEYPWRNPVRPLDVDNDGAIVPLDALMLVNDLNERHPRKLLVPARGDPGPPPFLDTNRDGYVSPVDVLLIVNVLNARSPLQPAASASARVSDAVMEPPLSAVIDVGITSRSADPVPSIQGDVAMQTTLTRNAVPNGRGDCTRSSAAACRTSSLNMNGRDAVLRERDVVRPRADDTHRRRVQWGGTLSSRLRRFGVDAVELETSVAAVAEDVCRATPK